MTVLDYFGCSRQIDFAPFMDKVGASFSQGEISLGKAYSFVHFCEVIDVVWSCPKFDFALNPPILSQGASENDNKYSNKTEGQLFPKCVLDRGVS